MEKGIPGTAMPSNDSFNDFQAATIVAYLRSFADNPSRASALVGHAVRGKQLFENKGGCLSCHRVKNTGSRVGPNLTEIGANRRGVELERALVDPNSAAAPQNRMVRVVTKDGATVTGRLLNIDTFTDSRCSTRTRISAPSSSRICANRAFCRIQHAVLKDKLSPQELADLVSYLASLKYT